MQDKLLEISGWILLIILWVLAIRFFDILPDIIPTKFDGKGEVVSTGSKTHILVLPAIATIVAIGLTVLNKYPHTFNYPAAIHQRNASAQYSNAVRMIRVLKLIVSCVCLLIVVMVWRSVTTGVTAWHPWILIICLALIFVPSGYFLVKSYTSK